MFTETIQVYDPWVKFFLFFFQPKTDIKTEVQKNVRIIWLFIFYNEWPFHLYT